MYLKLFFTVKSIFYIKKCKQCNHVINSCVVFIFLLKFLLWEVKDVYFKVFGTFCSRMSTLTVGSVSFGVVLC